MEYWNTWNEGDGMLEKRLEPIYDNISQSEGYLIFRGVIMEFNNHVRCKGCQYARPDKTASEKKWTAYECGNCASDYYKSLLNVNRAGAMQPKMVWPGCKWGKSAERREAI